MRIPGLISILIILLLFSCTIIKDGDILTMDQFDNLHLQSIDIIQQKGGNSGPGIPSDSKSVTATISKVDQINITSPFGNITRFVKIDFPTVSDLVFEFRSKPNSAATLEQYFLSDGRPYSFEVLKSSASLELYKFGYDNTKRLNKLVFYLGKTLISDDTLIYDNTGKNITRIVRRSPDPLKAGTITIQYVEGGSTNSIREFKPGFQIYSYSNAGTTGGCPSNSNSSLSPCAEFRRSDGTQTGNWPMKIVESLGITGNTKKLREITFDGFSGTRYYFHPLMILTNDFPLGKELMTIYMMDWWNPQAGDPGGMSQLKYKFSYGL